MDREKAKQYKKAWYLRNREKAITYTKNWQKKNRDKVNAKNRKWRKRNKDKVLVSTIHWRKKYPEKYRLAVKRWNETVLRERRQFRDKLRERMGGKCFHCGYNSEPSILHFHHLQGKKFNIGSYKSYSLIMVEKEAKKCILLCPNCHAIETRKQWLKNDDTKN